MSWKISKFFKRENIKPLTTDFYGRTEEIDEYREIRVKYLQTNYDQVLVVPINNEMLDEIYQKEIEVLDKEDSENNNLMLGIVFAVIESILGTVPSITVFT